MRKDHEDFCFPGFSYGIINILLTSSEGNYSKSSVAQQLFLMQQLQNTLGINLDFRKEEEINLAVDTGWGGDDPPGEGQHHQGPQRRSKKSVQMSLDTSIWNKWPNDYTIPASLCLKL